MSHKTGNEKEAKIIVSIKLMVDFFIRKKSQNSTNKNKVTLY
jgi:hypothetical protein